MKKNFFLVVAIFLMFTQASLIFASTPMDSVIVFRDQMIEAKKDADMANGELPSLSYEESILKSAESTAQTIVANLKAVLRISKVKVPTKGISQRSIQFMQLTKDSYMKFYELRARLLIQDLEEFSKVYKILKSREQETEFTITERLLNPGCYDDIQNPDRYYKKISYPRTIDTIVLHTSYYTPDNDPAIERISDSMYSVDGIMQVWNYYEVGPHYLIDRAGNIYLTAEEKNMAWHAGTSKMPSSERYGLNLFSIGIELLNGEKDYPTTKQLQALKWLIQDINTRHEIKHILGHDDVHFGQASKDFKSEDNKLGTIEMFIKTDPWNFPWHKMNLMMKELDSQYTE